MKTANQAFVSQEADMDDRVAILQADVANIKVTLTEMKLDVRELRGKLEAANDSVFAIRIEIQELRTELKCDVAQFREDVQRQFNASQAALDRAATELRGQIGQVRSDLEKAVGELTASIEKASGQSRAELREAVGQLTASIEKASGQSRAELREAFGQLSASIEKVSGRNTTAIANSKLWWLLTLASVLAFLAKSLGWF